MIERRVRVELPVHLRQLAALTGNEVVLSIDATAALTPRLLLDALEADYPMLRGTIRDQVTGDRRAFLRFFACEEDFSLLGMDCVLPDAVATSREPLLIVGAVAGG